MQRATIGLLLGLGMAVPAAVQPAAAQPAPAPPGQVQHSAPPAMDPQAQPTGPLSTAEIRALLDATRETAKATREGVDYARVVPDILTQILAKLDKLEDKLDKIENAIKAQNRRR